MVLAATLAMVMAGCAEEWLPTEPEGAYMLWRQALLSGDGQGVYDFLDTETRAVFDERVAVLEAMNEDIVRYLPQVDQKLARQQTGAVLLKDDKIKDGRDLFLALFQPEKFEATPQIEVGTEISEAKLNEAGDEVIIVVYAGQQFLLRREDDGVWRLASWRAMSVEKTQWILDNREALEQTVQDLINEEKQEVDAVIKYLVEQEKLRRAAQKEDR